VRPGPGKGWVGQQQAEPGQQQQQQQAEPGQQQQQQAEPGDQETRGPGDNIYQ